MADISSIKLPDNTSYDIKAKKIFYADCSTAKNVVNKVVSCNGFVLETGAIIAIRFTDTTTTNPSSGNITLNINGTGAKNIIPKGSNSVYNYGWGWAFCNNQTWLFMYNGTYFVHINQDNNTTYKDATTSAHGLLSVADKKALDILKSPLATCATARATAAKVATLTNFTLAIGATIAVKFTATDTTNPASGNLTLNVNGTGAKNIGYFRNGSKAALSYGTAGYFYNNAIHIFTYDGTYWLCMDWNSDNNTDTKVTAVGNHYTPTKSTTKSASGGTLTDITDSTSGTQVVTGVEMDAKGHVTGVTSVALKSTGAKGAVDSELSSTSTNPVQNKVVNSALAGKAAASHTHTVSQISDFPTSLPANGGNADTVGGKAANDFLQIADQMQFNNIAIEKGNHCIGDIDRHWRIWTDNEGGNFELGSPDLSRFIQMDCFDNNTFRIYSWRNSLYWGILEANHETGEITLGNRHVSDFALGYGGPLNQYLNGQSGDIRTLVYQLPIGGYIFNTADTAISGISFPMGGDCVMFWAPVKNPANNFIYGMLIIRPMVTTGATYICSVYNTNSYTDWQNIGADTSINSIHTGEIINISEGTAYPIDLPFTPVAVLFFGRSYNHHLNGGFSLSLQTNKFIFTPSSISTIGDRSLRYVAFRG